MVPVGLVGLGLLGSAVAGRLRAADHEVVGHDVVTERNHALEATGGDIENVDRFLGALRRVDLSDAPRGPMKFDDFGNPIQNVYVRRVEKVNGRLQNTVVHTFPNVSQFWTYKPEEFLKAPAYSRDSPPCKAC